MNLVSGMGALFTCFYFRMPLTDTINAPIEINSIKLFALIEILIIFGNNKTKTKRKLNKY